MSLLQAKAQAVVTASGVDPKAINIGSILSIIQQILQGLSLCSGITGTPPTAAKVHQTLANPNPRQQRQARRLVRQEFRRQPLLQDHVLDGVYATGKAIKHYRDFSYV